MPRVSFPFVTWGGLESHRLPDRVTPTLLWNQGQNLESPPVRNELTHKELPSGSISLPDTGGTVLEPIFYFETRPH